MEQLLSRQADLQHQIEVTWDETLKAQLVDELNMISNQIAEKQFEMEQQQAKEAALEEKVHAEGLPFAISGVDFTKMQPELIEVIELVVKADRRRIFAEHAVEVEQLENEISDRRESQMKIGYEHAKLQEEYDKACQELADQTTETLRLIDERNELRRNRDNAVAQLEEANAEIARLKDEISDYQKAQVFGEREAQNIIETNEKEAADINEAIKKLYLTSENFGAINKVTKPDGTFELVKTDDLNANWIPESEVTGQDSFRIEDNQTVAQDCGIPAAEDTLTPPPFPAEVQDAQHTVGGESIDTAVETETFEDEVRRRLGALEDRVFARVNEVA